MGDDPANHAYVSMKAKACKESAYIAFYTRCQARLQGRFIYDTHDKRKSKNTRTFSAASTATHELNQDIRSRLSKKRRGRLSPFNLGKLVAGLDTFAPCTPLGVMGTAEHGVEVKKVKIALS